MTSTVTIDAGGGVVIEESDEITAGICTGPEPPPDVSFTLSVTPSVTQAAVGDTVEYVYCGQNTSTIPLAEVRLVDDRIGVVLEGEEPIAPGESVCTTDVGITSATSSRNPTPAVSSTTTRSSRCRRRRTNHGNSSKRPRLTSPSIP